MSFTKSERTRQYIIEKAAPLFNKKGYADTSMMDIAAVTGFTKGAIYGNFENKDELAICVFEHNLAFIQGGLRTATRQHTNAIDKLFAMTNYYRSAFEQVAAKGGCAILNAAIEADDNMPALKLKVKASILAWKREICKTIELGKTQKCISMSVLPEKYAVLFIALIEGGIMLAKIMDEPSPILQTLDKIDDLIKNELKK